jgi:hypothetical protein
MEVTLSIPDKTAKEIGPTPEIVTRRVREMFALNAYNTRRFSHFDVRSFLGFDSWAATERFLRENDAPLQFDSTDLEKDLANFRRASGQ